MHQCSIAPSYKNKTGSTMIPHFNFPLTDLIVTCYSIVDELVEVEFTDKYNRDDNYDYAQFNLSAFSQFCEEKDLLSDEVFVSSCFSETKTKTINRTIIEAYEDDIIMLSDVRKFFIEQYEQEKLPGNGKSDRGGKSEVKQLSSRPEQGKAIAAVA